MASCRYASCTNDDRIRLDQQLTDIKKISIELHLDGRLEDSEDFPSLLVTLGLRYDFYGAPERNYALLCERLHRALADTTQSLHYDLKIKEIIVSGNLAIVRLTWTSIVTASGKQEATDETGLDVFGRQPDGSWKIIRYIAYPEKD